MPSTLASRRMTYKEIENYARSNSHAASPVELPNFSKSRAADKPRQARLAVAATHPLHKAAPSQRPQLVPSAVPDRQGRRAPLVVRLNRALRTVLVAFCGLAILGYGLDVAASNDVGRLQDQAKRLNEQNSELSAQLLKAISFQGIQDSVLGRVGLRVPEQVLIVKEVPPPQVPQFQANKHHFPIMSGY
jgi:hypothetical protein